MGLNFRVIDNLYYYYNREFNILKNQFTGETASPMAQEMGLTYSKQLFDCPLYANMRIFYRDEQNTESVLSYLSGQDRLDFGAGLTFRPSRDSEVFLNCRASNIWAEKASTDKHADFSLNWGLRFLWDTGLSWKTFGSFDGFVFYDDNADGLRQFGEKGVKNVEIMGSEGRKVRTDQDGYYNMSKIPGRFAELELNLKTLPKGFHPTSPVLREVEAVLGKVRSVDFGIASKTEISGIVFNDGNRNSSYDAGEKLISGVIVILDDKEKTATNTMGEFMYGKVSAGRHILKLDLKSIPLQFIPKVPIRKAVDVKEGTTFIYNIPLEKS